MHKHRVSAALALVQVFFGIHYFVAKVILASLPPRAWALLRISSAAVILIGFDLLFRRQAPRRAGDWGRLTLFAFFGVMLNQVLFVEGLSRTTPSHSAIINSLIPVMTLGIAILARREPATPGRLVAIAVSFASVLILLGVERFELQNQLVVGDVLTLANGLSFAIFLVLSRNYLRTHDALASTAYILGIGALGIACVGAGPLSRVEFGRLDAHFWMLALYAIVCATVVTYFLNSYALRHTDSSMVALFIYLQPPIATGLSMAYLGERPTLRFWVASAGVLTGVYLAVRERRLNPRPIS